jgi:hypothetical protein
MTEQEILEQVNLINELTQREVYIGDPERPIEVTDEYLRYIENFIRENDLYDRWPLMPY